MRWRPQARADAPIVGTWLVGPADAELAAPLVEALRARGRDAGTWTVDQLARQAPAAAGIVHLGGLVPPALDEPAAVLAVQERACGGLLAVLRAAPPSARVVALTAGGAGPASASANPAAAPLWGLLRTLPFEYPTLACKAIDVEAAVAIAEIAAELDADPAEDQVALRGDGRYVARLERIGDVAPGPALPRLDGDARLELRAGAPTWVPFVPAAPAPGEVLVRVVCAALTFHDVLQARARATAPIGHEASGVVEAIGAGVHDLRAGDRVMLLAPGAVATRLTVDARLAARLPGTLSFEQAAALPLPYLTALEAIDRAAPGARVLVLGATGGMGLAAVAVARAAGHEVTATAGRAEKRDHLSALGVAHVLDSRAQAPLPTAELVVNGLGGAARDRAIAAVAPGGVLVDLTRGAPPPRADIAFDAPDLAARFAAAPERTAALWRRLLARVPTLAPTPRALFPVERAGAALDAFAEARHVGRFVLTFDRAISWLDDGCPLRRDGSYVLFGGAGALGPKVAAWLVEAGAGHVVLADRRLPAAEVRADLPPEVRAVVVDAGEPTVVARLLEELDGTAPVRGIVVASAATRDGALADLTWADFAAVLPAKIAVAASAHRAALGRDLDFFVSFSSIASLLGSPGQANYSAANAFLDQLHVQRCVLGLPSSVVGWAPWRVGIGAAMGERARAVWDRYGIRSLDPARDLDTLGRILGPRQDGVGVFAIDWRRYLEQYDLPPRVLETVRPLDKVPAAPTGASPLVEEARARPERAADLLAAHVAALARSVLGLDEDLALDALFEELGLDSLGLLDLRNRLQRELAVALSPTVALAHPTPSKLGAHLAEKLVARTPPRPSRGSVDLAAQADEELARIEALLRRGGAR
jgi:NADPH:quinone reductase-like Zn-dependent oxidoreductase/acyl carrier protein